MAIRHESNRSDRMSQSSPYPQSASTNIDSQRESSAGKSNDQEEEKNNQESLPPKVYVGNLPFSTSSEDLKYFVESKVSSKVLSVDIFTTPDGRSKGSGLVQLDSTEAVDAMIRSLNDVSYQGRLLQVRIDREPVKKYRFDTPIDKTTDPNAVATTRLFVGNLSWNITWQDLKERMQTDGEVVNVEIFRNSEGKSKGCAVVEFQYIEGAQEAIRTLQDSDFRGRPMLLKVDQKGSNPVGSYRQGYSNDYNFQFNYNSGYQNQGTDYLGNAHPVYNPSYYPNNNAQAFPAYSDVEAINRGFYY